MPLDTKPEDKPAAIRFRLSQNDGAMEVTCCNLERQAQPPFHVQSSVLRFESRDAFKAKAVQVGMTPAVAEDADRSFNATARQLTEMGFLVQLPATTETSKQAA